MAKPGNEKTYKMLTVIKFCSASELHCTYTVTKRYKIKYLEYSRGDSLCWFDLQIFKVIQNFDKNPHDAPIWLTMNRHIFSSQSHRIIQYPELEGIEIESPHWNTGSKILLIATYCFIITYRLLQLKIPVEQVKLILFSPLKF